MAGWYAESTPKVRRFEADDRWIPHSAGIRLRTSESVEQVEKGTDFLGQGIQEGAQSDRLLLLQSSRRPCLARVPNTHRPVGAAA